MADTVATIMTSLRFQQCFGRRQSHLVNVIVYRCIFFYEGVRAGDIGFWLVIVIIGKRKYSTALSGKEIAHFRIELCAARVLLWAMISAGLPVRAMMLAIVNVFPDPVTP